MFDVAILGGTVVDGSGKPRFGADVYISGDKIALIHGGSEKYPSKAAIDASGLVVSPGFIDMHSHDDLYVASDAFNTPKLSQGVTTVVVGHCGMGTAVAPENSAALYDYQAGVLGAESGAKPESFADYLGFLDGAGSAVNVAPLVGHIPLRVAVAGFEGRLLSGSEMARMEQLAESAMEMGAFGISTGLTYQPVYHANPEELVVLGKVVARHGGLFTFHMRGYGSDLLDSLDEVIEVAKRSGARVHVCHLRTNRSNRDGIRKAIQRIEAALDDGVDIGFDNYPYTAGASILSQSLPGWLVEGGVERALARLNDRTLRNRAIDEMDERLTMSGPGNTMILGVRTDSNKRYEGHRLSEIAEDKGTTPGEAALNLYEAEEGRVSIASFVFAEEDVDLVNEHLLSIIISDGIHTEGKPHPRLYGTFPKFIRQCSVEGGLGLEEAIRKITSAPAAKMKLGDRGLLKEDLYADITIFHPEEIEDTATYENPISLARGIRHVLVNGRTIVSSGEIVRDAKSTGHILSPVNHK